MGLLQTLDEITRSPERVVESAAAALWRHGFFPQYPALGGVLKASWDVLRRGLQDYAEFHGISHWDKGAILESLHARRICAHPDRMEQNWLNKWPDPRISWSIINPTAFPNLTAEQVVQAFAWGWAQWASVCGIQPSYVEDPNQANVVVEAAFIDGQFGVLAWSELANGTMERKTQRFDLENWCISESEQPNQLDIYRTLTHEIGHVLGLGHIGQGNLLQPMYSWSLRTPQAGDIQEVVARYGPPHPSTPPAPPAPGQAPTPAGQPWQVVISGTGTPPQIEAPGYRVTLLK